MDFDLYSYGGLFLFAFLAATIVPVSSEGAVTVAYYLDMDAASILVWAGVGNSLGTLFNYGVGYFSEKFWVKGRIEIKAPKTWAIARKYGWLTLFISWLPFIGDPITIIAGIFKWNIFIFSAIVFSLRFLRYYVLLVTLGMI